MSETESEYEIEEGPGGPLFKLSHEQQMDIREKIEEIEELLPVLKEFCELHYEGRNKGIPDGPKCPHDSKSAFYYQGYVRPEQKAWRYSQYERNGGRSYVIRSNPKNAVKRLQNVLDALEDIQDILVH